MSSNTALIEEAPGPRSFNDVWKPIMYKNEIFFFKIKIENDIYEYILYYPKTALYFWEVIDQTLFLKRNSKLNNIKCLQNPNELKHILVEKQPKFGELRKYEDQNCEGPTLMILNAIYEMDESKCLKFEWHLKRMSWAEYQANILESMLLMMVSQADQMICLREELHLREAQLAQYKKTETKTETETEDKRNHKTTRPFSFDSFDSFFFKRNQCASGILYMSHYFISPQITINQLKRNPDYTNEVPTGQPQTQAMLQVAMALKIIARYERTLYRSKNKMSLLPKNKCTGDIPCHITGMRGFLDSHSDQQQYSLNLFALDCNCRCLVCPSLRNELLNNDLKFLSPDLRHLCNCQCAKCIIWRKELMKKEDDGQVSEIEDYDSNLEPGSVSNLEQQDWSYELAVMYSRKNSRHSPEVTMARQRIAANKEMTMEMANNEASYQKKQMKKKELKNDLPLQIDDNLKIEKYYDKLIKYLSMDDQKKSTKCDDDVVVKIGKCNQASSNRPLDSFATSTNSKIAKKLNQKQPENAEPNQQLALQKLCQKPVKKDSYSSNLTPMMSRSSHLEHTLRQPVNLTKFDNIFEYDIQKPKEKRTHNENNHLGSKCSGKCKAKNDKKCYSNDRK